MPGSSVSSAGGVPGSSVSSASSGCTDAQIMGFDCDISENEVGVLVCREGATTLK